MNKIIKKLEKIKFKNLGKSWQNLGKYASDAKTDHGFVICDPENRRVPKILKIKNFQKRWRRTGLVPKCLTCRFPKKTPVQLNFMVNYYLLIFCHHYFQINVAITYLLSANQSFVVSCQVWCKLKLGARGDPPGAPRKFPPFPRPRFFRFFRLRVKIPWGKFTLVK